MIVRNLLYFSQGTPIVIFSSERSGKEIGRDTLKQDADLAMGRLEQVNDNGEYICYKVFHCIPNTVIYVTKNN